MAIEIPIRLLRPGACLPEYQTLMSAGADLRACLEATVDIEPGRRRLIPCGFAMELPAHYEAQVRPRSGLALRYGIGLVNSPGTIDADYRGELQILLVNWGETTFAVNHGDRIAQIVIVPVPPVIFRSVDALGATVRGGGGFGSTGR